MRQSTRDTKARVSSAALIVAFWVGSVAVLRVGAHWRRLPADGSGARLATPGSRGL